MTSSTRSITFRVPFNYANFLYWKSKQYDDLPSLCSKLEIDRIGCYTRGLKSNHSARVKYFNDFLSSQTSKWDRDEVTFFNVGNLFCIHLGTKYANFQEKIFAEISGKNFQTLGIT